MIFPGSKLNVADNSGAKKVKCIQVLERTGRTYAKIGSKIVISILDIVNSADKKVTVGTVYHAIVVRTKKGKFRSDGSFIKFSDNSVVIIEKDGNIIGTRVFGVIPMELKKLGYKKIISLSQEIC